MLSTANITMQFGAKPLFENISVKFGDGNRYGLIGANGCGKSTFMKILGGDLEPSSGNVMRPADVRLGKLRQDQFAYEQHSVLDTVIMGHAELALIAAERERIEAAIGRGHRVVALDERGTSLSTVDLAAKLREWQEAADDVSLVIGGPDGLDPAFRQAAHERIRLSDLTLPHAFVRVLLIEQLYRAWSINAHHPYHRE